MRVCQREGMTLLTLELIAAAQSEAVTIELPGMEPG